MNDNIRKSLTKGFIRGLGMMFIFLAGYGLGVNQQFSYIFAIFSFIGYILMSIQ